MQRRTCLVFQMVFILLRHLATINEDQELENEVIFPMKSTSDMQTFSGDLLKTRL